MKKYLPIAAALVLALAGCGGGQKAEETATTTETETATEAVEDTKEEEADQGTTVEWTTAATDEDAAKGAGFEKFGVLPKIVLGDMTFENPTFGYAGGVAQAVYETPATMLTLRKGMNSYTAPLTDRKVEEFAAHWNKIIEGTDVSCYGSAKGAVTVATWTDGSKSYALTWQGLGGEEMSMDVDELATIVKGVNEANADTDSTEQTKTDEKKTEQKKTEEKKTDNQQSSNNSNQSLMSQAEAEKLVEETCGGVCVTISQTTTDEYGLCWYATAVDDNDNNFAYYVNNSGIYLIGEEGSVQPTMYDGHYEGEPVTIYGSVYAEWHMADGEWYATFTTYNGTQIFAQPAEAGGGWVFNALYNGQTIQVIYSDQESSETGEYGPAGVSSHWQALDGGAWY